ncbi:MAG: hypothetical protein JSS57_20975 [Proteobacteria bacterium]|nr:hypothetical protein [Pseudomonadota bacterium]
MRAVLQAESGPAGTEVEAAAALHIHAGTIRHAPSGRCAPSGDAPAACLPISGGTTAVHPPFRHGQHEMPDFTRIALGERPARQSPQGFHGIVTTTGTAIAK